MFKKSFLAIAMAMSLMSCESGMADRCTNGNCVSGGVTQPQVIYVTPGATASQQPIPLAPIATPVTQAQQPTIIYLNGSGQTTVNPIPGQPVVGGIPAGRQSDGTAIPVTAPEVTLYIYCTDTQITSIYSQLPARGYEGNIENGNTGWFGTNTRGYEARVGSAIQGVQNGNQWSYDISGGKFIRGEHGNAFYVSNTHGAVWQMLDGARAITFGSCHIGADPNAPSKSTLFKD